MKTMKLFLLLYAIAFACEHTQAQDDMHYRPFKSFNNDTIQYLDYNYFIRGDKYNGKKIADLINELELQIKSIHGIMAISSREDAKIVGIELLINKKKQWSLENYYINIDLITPISFFDFISVRTLVNDNEGNSIIPWTTELYEFLKNKEIKSVSANSNLIEKRRKLMDMHTNESDEQLKKVIEAEKANWRKRIQAEKASVESIKQ